MKIEPSGKKRGRPSKRGQSPEVKGHSHWLGGLFINEGSVWASELVEIGPVDCGRHWEVYPICLGREHDVVPILKGA